MEPTTISSLALLKVRYDIEKADYLDLFFPFIAYILKKENILSFKIKDLQPMIEKEFGLIIPQHTLLLISNRMSKRGVFNRSLDRYTLKKFPDGLDTFERDRSTALKHQKATIESLKDFSKERLNLVLTEDECINSLYCYIDQYCIECVEAYECNSIVPIRGKAKDSWRYIVSSYVNEISKKDPLKFDYFLTTIKGRMIANALIGADLTQVRMKFKNTTVYLDTPLILQLLGVLGDDFQKLIDEMLA